MKNAVIKTKESGASKRGKLMLVIGAPMVIGIIAFGAACGVSKPETNNASALETATVNKKSAANAPAKTSSVETAKINSAPPQILADAGEFAENIYDFAKAKNWAKADEKLAGLRKALDELKAKNLAAPQLVETTDVLAAAVKAKNEIEAMREANQATFLVADETAKYSLKIPVEVTKLDYYGREIEILTMTKDEAKLKLTAQAIRQTWNQVKPKIEAKNATKETAKFESLVAQTEKAASIADYAKIVAPILDEVDNLEKVFER